jgi:hypothetical protein
MPSQLVIAQTKEAGQNDVKRMSAVSGLIRLGLLHCAKLRRCPPFGNFRPIQAATTKSPVEARRSIAIALMR